MNGCVISVIFGCSKTLVYDLARYVNTQIPVIPERILEKAPSAEFKPDQTDQDDLPPYEVLDAILKASIEDLKTFDDIVRMGFEPALVRASFPGSIETNTSATRRPPGLKVTSKAFGYGRRYPLAKHLTGLPETDTMRVPG